MGKSHDRSSARGRASPPRCGSRGVDPKAERLRHRAQAELERAETALSFDALVAEWATLHLAHRRPRYSSEAQRAIRRVFADLMKRPAARITRTDVVNVLDKLVEGGKTAMAGRTLAYARACFQWAVKRGKIPSNPFLELPIPAGANQRDRVLTHSELAEVWAAAGTLSYPFGPFFRIAILTLQRREEVAAMRWSEISGDMSLWTIPGSRMKNGKLHDVHIAAPARAVLLGIPRVTGSDLVFSTTGTSPISGFSRGKAKLDTAIETARGEAGHGAGRTRRCSGGFMIYVAPASRPLRN